MKILLFVLLIGNVNASEKDLGSKIQDGDILTPVEQILVDEALKEVDQMIADEEQARGQWHADQEARELKELEELDL